MAEMATDFSLCSNDQTELAHSQDREHVVLLQNALKVLEVVLPSILETQKLIPQVVSLKNSIVQHLASTNSRPSVEGVTVTTDKMPIKKEVGMSKGLLDKSEQVNGKDQDRNGLSFGRFSFSAVFLSPLTREPGPLIQSLNEQKSQMLSWKFSLQKPEDQLPEIHPQLPGKKTKCNDHVGECLNEKRKSSSGPNNRLKNYKIVEYGVRKC